MSEHAPWRESQVLRAAFLISLCTTIRAWQGYDGGGSWMMGAGSSMVQVASGGGGGGPGMLQVTGGGGGGGGLPVGIVTMDPGVLEIGSIIDVIEAMNAGGLTDVAGQPIVGGASGPDPNGKVLNIDTTPGAPQKTVQVERSRAAGQETLNVNEGAGPSSDSDVVVQQNGGGSQRTVSVSSEGSAEKDVTIQDDSARSVSSGAKSQKAQKAASKKTSGSTAKSQSGGGPMYSIRIIDTDQQGSGSKTAEGGGSSGSIAISQSGDGSADDISIIDAEQDTGSVNVQGRAAITSKKSSTQKARGTSGSSGVQSSDVGILSEDDGASLSIIEGNDSAGKPATSLKVAPRKGRKGTRGGGNGSGGQSSNLQIQGQDDTETISIAESHADGKTGTSASGGPRQVSVRKPASGGGVVISTGEAEEITLSDDVMSFIRILAKSGKTSNVPRKKAKTSKPISKRKHRTWKPTSKPQARPKKPPAYTPTTPKPQASPPVAHYGVSSSSGYSVHKETPTYQGVHSGMSPDPLAFIRQLENLQKLMAMAMLTTPTAKPAYGHGPAPAYPSAPAEAAPDAYRPPAHHPAYPPPAPARRPDAPRHKKTFKKHGSPAPTRVYFSGAANRPQGRGRIQNAYGPPSTTEAPTLRPPYGPAVSTHPVQAYPVPSAHDVAYSTPVPSYTTGHVQTHETPHHLPAAPNYHNASQGDVYYGFAAVPEQASVASSGAYGPWESAPAKQGHDADYGRWNASTTAYGDVITPKAVDDHPWTPISPPVKVKTYGRKGTWKKKGRFLKMPRYPKGGKSSSARWPDAVSGYVASGSEKDEDVVPIVLHLPADAFKRTSQGNKWSLMIVKQNVTDTSEPGNVPDAAAKRPGEQ